jgi:competence protein ComEA
LVGGKQSPNVAAHIDDNGIYLHNNHVINKETLMKHILSFLGLSLAGIHLALAAVNINTANQSELDGVKGIGPSKAQAIIDYRTKNGPFKSLDDLKNVKGFGDKSIAKLKGELSVNGGDSAKK